jgi:hypothetical protein
MSHDKYTDKITDSIMRDFEVQATGAYALRNPIYDTTAETKNKKDKLREITEAMRAHRDAICRIYSLDPPRAISNEEITAIRGRCKRIQSLVDHAILGGEWTQDIVDSIIPNNSYHAHRGGVSQTRNDSGE